MTHSCQVLIKPHGANHLVNLRPQSDDLLADRQRAACLSRLPITQREYGDLLMLAMGAFTPLTGFMGYDDWRSVCETMQLNDGTLWPIPITISADANFAESLQPNEDIALALEDGSHHIVAILNVSEKYKIDKNLECMAVYGTQDVQHPGVTLVHQQSVFNLAGQVTLLDSSPFAAKFPKLFVTPAQMRQRFQQLGWQNVTAFQTRNPMHCAHEYLVKQALATSDGVLIHSLLGGLKPGDIPATVACHAIDVLIKHYFKQQAVLHAGYPLTMRYAGPREALLHAIFRQNYGCRQIIIGRDHAGVGDYYAPYAAQTIFSQIPQDSLLIKPLKLEQTFWCEACQGMQTAHSCPHDDQQHLLLSGTKLRALLASGAEVPAHFSRPEVLAVLRAYYQSQSLFH